MKNWGLLFDAFLPKNGLRGATYAGTVYCKELDQKVSREHHAVDHLSTVARPKETIT